jgi:tetratricopeptide (TPR) repeat protein
VHYRRDGTSTSLLEEIEQKKAVGNAHFKAGDNAAAITAYHEGIEAVKRSPPLEADEELVNQVLISLHNNACAALIRLEDWESADLSASKVIELDRANSKALLRRGIARSRMGSGKPGLLSMAESDLLGACKLDPKDRTARAELTTVQAALKVHRDHDRHSLKSSFAAKFGAAINMVVCEPLTQ